MASDRRNEGETKDSMPIIRKEMSSTIAKLINEGKYVEQRGVIKTDVRTKRH